MIITATKITKRRTYIIMCSLMRSFCHWISLTITSLTSMAMCCSHDAFGSDDVAVTETPDPIDHFMTCGLWMAKVLIEGL